MSDLHQLLLAVLDETDLTDPHDVAQEVRARIDEEQIEDFFTLTLQTYVRKNMTTTRTGVPDELIGRRPHLEVARPAQNISRGKAALYRDWWTSFVNERVQVEGTWKLMGECTVPEVEALASTRREVAARNAAHAARFEALAARMRDAGATTVSDLDRVQAQAALAA